MTGDVCVFRRFIDCTFHDKCETCGWNPKVEEERKKKLADKKVKKDV